MAAPIPARPEAADRGFTLIELLVTLAVSAILFGIAGTSIASWSAKNTHKGSRDQVVSVLRLTAERALSEGKTYCVSFAANGSWKTYRTSCSSGGALIGGAQGLTTSGETLVPSFTYDTGLTNACSVGGASAAACAYFYPRGTASEGTVLVRRSGRSDYTVHVKQLTSRVYFD